MRRFQIYLDMDDVITDLMGSLIGLGMWTESEIKEKKINQDVFWNTVNKQGVKFWSEMAWTKNGKDLYKLVSKSSPIILSAYKKDGIYTLEGKKMWIKNNLGNLTSFFCQREEKQGYATPISVLIDDREDNIQEWIKNGGIGILYNDKNFYKLYLKIKKYCV
jgi:hypothetical protein